MTEWTRNDGGGWERNLSGWTLVVTEESDDTDEPDGTETHLGPFLVRRKATSLSRMSP